jgi:multiple sugar transport system permease protein
MNLVKTNTTINSRRRERLTKNVKSIFTHFLLILASVIMLIPFVWMVSTSFKPATEILAWPPKLIPINPTWANYFKVFNTTLIVRYFFNSLIIAVVSTLFVLATSLVAGYIFAKFRFPGRDLLFLLIVATAIVPFEAYMVPFYLQMIVLKWINTYQGIIAPYMIMSFGIFLMRQHISSAIPDEFIDAARIDGASEWSIFRLVIVPMSTSAMGALGTFAFIQAWGAFIWPLLIASNDKIFNMELGLAAFQFKFSVDYGPLMAGSVLNIIPIIIAFIFLRRQIIENIALSGLKG